MFDPLTHFRLIEAEKGTESALLPGEDLAATMHRARLARLRESQFVPEPCQQWRLDENAWLLESQAPNRQPSPVDRLPAVVGDALIGAGAWLQRRSRTVAELQA